MAMLACAAAAHAQVPADIYNYSRESSFTYDNTTGLLLSETVEQNNAGLCVTTSYAYVEANGKNYGNRVSATTANCAGAPTGAQFASRASSSSYAPATAQTVTVTGTTVAVPQGVFARSSTNALSQTESKTYDPRFGAALSLTGPNGLTTSWQIDDFGRKIKEIRPDNTSVVMYYCILGGVGLDTSSNTPGCPAPAAGEVPAEAVQFVHSEPRDTAGAKMGPFSRVYSDRMGRTVRSVTESFDGAGQPAAVNGVAVVQDTVYSAYGPKFIETQPYFLVNGSSLTAGANDRGVTLTRYDVLGRPTSVDVTDPSGNVANVAFGGYITTTAARTSYSYNGQRATTTNSKGQTRTEEKNANGEVVLITDHNGAQLARQYDAFGNLVQTQDALQNVIAVQYDIRGRKLQMNDPDSGVWGYCYDALGQLKAQQSPNMRGSQTPGACPASTGTATTATAVTGWTTFAYDTLGRMTQRLEPEYSDGLDHFCLRHPGAHDSAPGAGVWHNLEFR